MKHAAMIRSPLASALAFALALVACGPRPAHARCAAPMRMAPDSIGAASLIQPAALNRMLALPAARRPALLHVGFKVLYRGGHIPGSRYAGPTSKPEGMKALHDALAPLPRTRTVVLYCGCCPWQDCPNVRPAYRAARALGFRNVRVLYVAKDFEHDWADAGLPVAKGE
ncbi:MAG TPA: rhodanese-like domain-containing protein [Candidatus Eisenbacteria bacterium]|nr:rhodanese-like domain-containing protein [Candidatus Eisenbacteria bacterium]